MYSETILSRNETFLGKNRITEEERVWFYSFQSKWSKLFFTLINIFLPPPRLFYGKSDWGICIFWDCVVCTSSEGSITRKVRPMRKDIRILWSPFFWNSSDWGICIFEIVWCALILKGRLPEKYVPCDKIFAYYEALFFEIREVLTTVTLSNHSIFN